MVYIIFFYSCSECEMWKCVVFPHSSKAVLWLGRLRLSCSEEQLQRLIGLLSHSLAFGPVSSWGSEVFIEIGAIAGTAQRL